MNNIVITKETAVKEALAGNGVLMVGRIPNNRELGLNKPSQNEDDVVEIPSFLLKAQEERRITKILQQSSKKKKVSYRKPSLKTIIVNALRTL